MVASGVAVRQRGHELPGGAAAGNSARIAPRRVGQNADLALAESPDQWCRFASVPSRRCPTGNAGRRLFPTVAAAGRGDAFPAFPLTPCEPRRQRSGPSGGRSLVTARGD